MNEQEKEAILALLDRLEEVLPNDIGLEKELVEVEFLVGWTYEGYLARRNRPSAF